MTHYNMNASPLLLLPNLLKLRITMRKSGHIWENLVSLKELEGMLRTRSNAWVLSCLSVLSVKFTIIQNQKYESAMSTCLTRPALSCAPYSSPVYKLLSHWYPPFAAQSVFSDMR